MKTIVALLAGSDAALAVLAYADGRTALAAFAAGAAVYILGLLTFWGEL